jgi:16S rRNA G966 N2-methylase RsmD
MNTSPNEQLREELKQAIANVLHQIEIQGMSDHYVGSGAITVEAIGELRAELAQLEQALADLQ